MAAGASPPLLCYIRDVARVGVRHGREGHCRKRGEVNGKHVCEDENVMRQEASE
jgi:hypothetical protein